MAVFSRFSGVLEPDGAQISVRSTLARINEILDQVLHEQEDAFDPPTQFAIAWYRQHGYGIGTFGDADNLARARNTSVATMDRNGILTSRAGKVQLITLADLPLDDDVDTDEHISSWAVLHHVIKIVECDGIAAAGEFLRTVRTGIDGGTQTDLVTQLAYLLFGVAEKNGWTKETLRFNTMATS